jgi:long-subunit acyl-CoA synthetase (AMP-forming)
LNSGVGCGIYTTNTTEACEYILKDSKSQIVVVENKQQLDKILKCKEKLPIKKIIQYSGTIENDYDGLVISVIIFFCFIKQKPFKLKILSF